MREKHRGHTVVTYEDKCLVVFLSYSVVVSVALIAVKGEHPVESIANLVLALRYVRVLDEILVSPFGR